MADLNDINKPTVANLHADVIDTLRENTKRVSNASVPISGATFTGPINAPAVSVLSNPVWHSGNLIPANYMPLAGGTFTGTVLLAHNAAAALEPVPKQQFDAKLGLPTGGTTGQILKKNSATAGDAVWGEDLWQGAHKTVSAAAPSGGIDGDVWFQLE